MKKILLVLVIGGIATAVLLNLFKYTAKTSSLRKEQSQRNIPREQTCGPKCVWIAANLAGEPLEWWRVANHFRDGSNDGTTLQELCLSLNEFGLNARSCKLKLENLLTCGKVAILFLRRDHFVAVDLRDSTSNMFDAAGMNVYDWDECKRVYKLEDLRHSWNGECVLISLGKDSQNSDGPVASFESCYHDVGLVSGELAVSHSFQVTNNGNEPLESKILGASCGCANARVVNNSCIGGEKLSIDVKVDLKGKMGRFRETVEIETNDPKCKKVSLILCGGLPRKLLLSTQRVFAGNMPAGSSKNLSLAVYSPDNNPLLIRSARLKNEHDEDKANLHCKFMSRTFENASLSERNQLELLTCDGIIDAEVAVPVEATPGRFLLECVATTDHHDLPQIEFAIEGQVLPDLQSEPSVLRLSVKNRNEGKNQLSALISSVSGKDLTGLVALDKDDILHDIKIERSKDGTLLTAFFDTSKIDLPFNGEIHCTTSDRRCLDIPYFVFE